MKIRAEIYLSPYVDCDDNRQDSVCAAVWEGIFQAEQARSQNGAGAPALTSLHSVEYIRGGEEEKALDITATPTLIFFDDSRNVALSKLSRSQISKGRVKSTFLYLASLAPSSDGDSYIDADGDEVGSKDLIDMWGDGKWGFGLGLGQALGGCPKWMPKVICDFPFWIISMVVVLLIILFILKLAK